MKSYKVTYSGNSSRFRNFEVEILANSEREAVETAFSQYNDANYFPQGNGIIKDSDGVVIATATSKSIEYDGGFFVAEEI